MFSVDLPCPRMGELLLRYLTSAAQPSYAPYTPLHILTHVTPNLTVLSPIVLTLPTLLLSLVLLGLSLSLSCSSHSYLSQCHTVAPASLVADRCLRLCFSSLPTL